jgi:RNA polymerase sigma factor (sigma-70 family)
LTRIPDFSTVGDDLNGQAFRFFVNPSISAIFPLFSTHRFLYASGSRHITKTNEPRLEEKNQDGNLFQFQTLAIKVELYERFYRDNKERIFAYLLRLTGDYHLAGDLTQESFTRCLARYGRNGNNRALLYTIARNAALDAARKRREEALGGNEDAPAGGGDPERRLIDKQAVDRTLAAIGQLNPVDRELIALLAADTFSYRQIGRLLDISENNVKVKVHRARLRLKAILNPDADNDGGS